MKTTELQSRVANLRLELAAEGIEAALITTAANTYYYSGFHSSNCLLLVTAKDALFLTDFRYLSKAAAEIKHLVVDDIRRVVLKEILDGSVKEVGFEGEASYLRVEELKRNVPKRRFRNITPILRKIRNVKSKYEILQIAANQSLTETILTSVMAEIRVGSTEKKIRAAIRTAQLQHDADEAFDSIVAVGANSANPHAIAGNGKVAGGKFLLIDMGTRRNHYYSDMTRTFAVTTASAKARDIYTVVLEAQLAALDSIKPGVECSAVDAVARKVISLAGYGEYFGHGLGHGVGLEIHEGPTLRSESREVLEPGMVVTVEPGIYLPGFGGVRIEDTVVVTSKGIRNLNKLSKDLAFI